MTRREIARIARKRYWREEDAKVVVAGWRSSGETMVAYARHVGVDWQRLRRWASRLSERRSPAVRFHPVRLSQPALPAAAIEIHVGGCRVVVGAGVQADDLKQVLAAVRESAAC